EGRLRTGARHVSPATDRRGPRFLVSASCRFAGMAAPRRFLYDEAAATLHRILTIECQPIGAPPPEGRPYARARACSRNLPSADPPGGFRDGGGDRRRAAGARRDRRG